MTSETSRPQPRPSSSKESGLLQRARQFLRDRFPGTRPHLVVGYSGGRDSLALLLVLRDLERLGACRLTVAHVDHGLRLDSGDDARRAVEVGHTLGVEVRVRRPEVPVPERYAGRGIEDAARAFRYAALAGVLAESGADAVAVGHHARDQAETVLLHLLRGSGLAGLAGMAADSQVPVEEGRVGSVRVLRPFLHESPATIAEVVEQSGLPVIEDPSNASPDFRRNRIRHELLPLMEAIVPGATGRLGSLADLAREDETALADVAHALVHGATTQVGHLRWSAIERAPAGLQRRVVREWILHGGFPGELTRERVDAVVDLARRNTGGKGVQIGAGWSVRYDGGYLSLAGQGASP